MCTTMVFGVRGGAGEDETGLGRDGTGCCTTGSERRERKETGTIGEGRRDGRGKE